MESLVNYIKKCPYIFGILIGIMFILDAIFKWNWLLNNNSSNSMIDIYEVLGEIGVRILTGILGLIIIISCIIIFG
ncbi:hypothetical protein BFL38_04190 [Brachyspira hampsonii]|uniref:Immunity protein 17 n=2 Tax=Brachyspira hampsonii TaxID=1287055 RepID=A0A1E5NCR8_9SPIR|nr:Imm17 family immunity protein [Brachyspira hampsonii]OEJ13945.1 hypothetical protein BFL38_04190 [Brachyspira hampsonii]